MSDVEEMTGKRAVEAAVPDRMSGRQKLALAVLLGAQFMLAADFSILTVSLPVIGDSLGFSLDSLQWITTGFALPAAGFTLLFGRIADLFGRRKVFLLGIVLLAAASLVGGFAQSSEVLVAARVAQGVATAISVPSALSLLTTTFPEGPLRQRALGLNGALLGGGFSAGALLGGALTELFSWRWSFLINVPVALLVLVGTLMVIPEGRAGGRTRLDVPGAVTVTGGLLALVFGITTAGHQGWAEPTVSIWLGVAVLLLIAFWFIELKSPNPLAPVRVLKRRTVGWGNFGGFASIAMATAISFTTTLYMQKVLGFSAFTTGVVIGLPGILTIVGGTIAPRLLGRIGAPAVLALSLVVQSAGYAVLLWLNDGDSGVVLVLVALAVGFFGHAYKPGVVHGDGHLGTAGRGAGARHRSDHDEHADRDHPGHPGGQRRHRGADVRPGGVGVPDRRRARRSARGRARQRALPARLHGGRVAVPGPPPCRRRGRCAMT